MFQALVRQGETVQSTFTQDRTLFPRDPRVPGEETRRGHRRPHNGRHLTELGAAGGRGARLMGKRVGWGRWRLWRGWWGRSHTSGDGLTGTEVSIQKRPSGAVLYVSSTVKSNETCGAEPKVNSQGAERAGEKKRCAEELTGGQGPPPRPRRCRKLPGSQG